MTDKEICDIQRKNGNSEMYLLQRGVLWFAYDGAALALAKVTDYQLKKRKATDRYELQFTDSELEKVLAMMRINGMTVRRDSKELICFIGGNADPDEYLLDHEGTEKVELSMMEIKTMKEIRKELMEINLADEAMDYAQLSRLVRKLQVKCLSELKL